VLTSFFVLSGFILAHVHMNDFSQMTLRGMASFLVLRLIRIYPVHLAMLLVTVIFAAALLIMGVPIQGGVRFDPKQLVPNLFLAQA
jgi:peptidoglycan/LPS O-acetylase OafA/YrhL